MGGGVGFSSILLSFKLTGIVAKCGFTDGTLVGVLLIGVDVRTKALLDVEGKQPGSTLMGVDKNGVGLGGVPFCCILTGVLV